jgi:hypothetical protein
MKKSQLRQIIKEEITKELSEYSLKQPTGGYVNTVDTDINMFLHQIARTRGNDLTNNKMKLEKKDWENIIKILGDYLEERFKF